MGHHGNSTQCKNFSKTVSLMSHDLDAFCMIRSLILVYTTSTSLHIYFVDIYKKKYKKYIQFRHQKFAYQFFADGISQAIQYSKGSNT